MVPVKRFGWLLALAAVACTTAPDLVTSTLSAAELGRVEAKSYRLGPKDASIAFDVKPIGVPRVTGAFAEFDAVLTIVDPVSGLATLGATVNVDSLSVSSFEEMVRGPGWFDVKTYPTAVFNGQLEGWDELGYGTVMGDLTVRDVTRPEKMDIYLTCDRVTAPCPSEAIGFEGQLSISRSAYGMTRFGGFVSDTVNLTISGTIKVVAAPTTMVKAAP